MTFFDCKYFDRNFKIITRMIIIYSVFKGMVSEFAIKFWMCQKCGKMKYYPPKNLTNDYKHTGYDAN
jgi:hypothetical protein